MKKSPFSFEVQSPGSGFLPKQDPHPCQYFRAVCDIGCIAMVEKKKAKQLQVGQMLALLKGTVPRFYMGVHGTVSSSKKFCFERFPFVQTPWPLHDTIKINRGPEYTMFLKWILSYVKSMNSPFKLIFVLLYIRHFLYAFSPAGFQD